MSKGGLRLQNIRFSFGKDGQRVDVIDGIDLAAGENEFIALVGPSGCGKSTLFHAIAGLIRPSSGAVVLNGQDITGTAGHVAYMMQKDLMLAWRTVTENVILGAEINGQDKKRTRAEAQTLMRRFGLSGFEDYYPAALSGGMRQRAAMLRTVLCNKPVMLLDEPFAALDALTRTDMREWLLGIWQEFRRTVVLVTHDVEEAIFLADRVYVLSPRPARITGVIDVPFSRPRSAEDIALPQFVQLKRDLLELVRAGAATPERLALASAG
jgi:ABC-type nitrate/sulfonate/bicarbonate transport system ATPase subunit